MNRKRALILLGAVTGFIASVVGGFTATTTAYAADSAAWTKDRQQRYAAYQAAHPNPEAEIAQIKARTAVMIAAYAPPPQARGVEAKPVIWRASSRPAELWDGIDAPEMVVVPAGDYAMGSPTTEPNRDVAEGPQHRVRIGYALAVSKYPITVGEFARFVADTHYVAGDRCYTSDDGLVWKNEAGHDWRRPGFDQTDASPVVCMNWDDARAYSAWLSKKTGRAYRLMSEAEYEYADRGGTTTAYWWGDDASAPCSHANGSDLDMQARFPKVKASPCHDGYVFTSPVGSFQANGFGLYDTAGDVWSWVEDCWNDTYASAPTDGSANATGDCRRHLLRGGSWYYYPRNLRAADRYGNETGPRVNMDGFRVAATL